MRHFTYVLSLSLVLVMLGGCGEAQTAPSTAENIAVKPAQQATRDKHKLSDQPNLAKLDH